MPDAGQCTDCGRRDFVVQGACGFVAVGAAACAWPLIDQMSPNEATSRPEIKEVDLAAIKPGQTVLVAWRGKPIFVRNRTDDELRIARKTPLNELRDQLARNASLAADAPATDVNRTIAGHENWLVVSGACTHLGCLLTALGGADAVGTDEGEGWFCKCHAARYDLSGRVIGGPALTNLAVPPCRIVSHNRLEIG